GGPRLPRLSMYGVVVCPRCKRAKGVNLKQKTTTCQCGFEIYVVPARIRARAVTARELAPLVGQVSAEIAGGTGEYRRARAPAPRQRSRQNLAVHVVVNQQSKPHGRHRGDRAVRLVHLEKERSEERSVCEADTDGPEERAPRVAARSAEADQRAGVCVHETEADRVDNQEDECLRDVEDLTRCPRRRDDAACRRPDSQRYAIECRVEPTAVAPAVQPSELERLLEDKAHPDGDGERREVPPRQREGEDARHGPEDETDGEAPEHATIVEQGVIDQAVVRLSRAFGLDREKALKLFDAGFRHTKQLRDRDPEGILEKGEVGLLFICTNCGGFVAAGDAKCPRCAAEFEAEPEPADAEEDILDLVLCPACGADNDPELDECEICGSALRESREPGPVATE